MPALRDRLQGAYSIPPTAAAPLPNVIRIHPVGPKDTGEAPAPLVVFLARLDPYKRPWLLVALAQAFPHVSFVAAGQPHFSGTGQYTIPRLANLHLVAHVNETSKRELLTRAWFIINLSVHEGLAVSFLEALSCETPIIALVNPGGLVSSYGRFVGEFPGDGMAALPGLKRAFSELLSNRSLRRDLGARGRRHVQATHNEQMFLQSFSRLLRRLDVASTSARCSALPTARNRSTPARARRNASRPGDSLSGAAPMMVRRLLSSRVTSELDVSVVIPSFDRMQTLHVVLAALLRSRSFAEGTKSEILIAHASNASLSAQSQIGRSTAQACGSCDLRRISHLDLVELNAEIGCTVRYLAATHARNPVVIHLDDDNIPTAGLLSALARAVAIRSIPLAGPTGRRCGAAGYCNRAGDVDMGPWRGGCRGRPRCAATDASFVLTNVAAVPFDINARFVAAFRDRRLPYRALMAHTHGEGCDLIFNVFLYDHGLGEPIIVGKLEHNDVDDDDVSYRHVAKTQLHGGYQNSDAHFSTRAAICRCFAAGRFGPAPPSDNRTTFLSEAWRPCMR